jgi:hypothetical protein
MSLNTRTTISAAVSATLASHFFLAPRSLIRACGYGQNVLFSITVQSSTGIQPPATELVKRFVANPLSVGFEILGFCSCRPALGARIAASRTGDPLLRKSQVA